MSIFQSNQPSRSPDGLDAIFAPRSVAIIGASQDPTKLGHAVVYNVVEHGFQGGIYPVNPRADEILGLKAYPSVLDVPDPVDLAVVVVPSKAVATVLDEAAQKGVKGVIVITAGFREVGPEGMAMEKELIAIVRDNGMRMIGPNCLGIIDTYTPLQASFALGMPEQGKIAFMSQSGALCTSILDMALADDIGFSRFVSLGNKADLNEIDFLEAWGQDPKSRVITAYLEGITDGDRFIEVAQQVTKHTPFIAIKSGTTQAGSRAVSSHTGTLAGSERAYEAAFRQAGVLRAGSVQDLFDQAVAFANQPLPTNSDVAVVTNAGGPGIMATDALERAGLKLASLTAETQSKLRAGLPPAASALNPVDVLGDAMADRYALAVNLVADDPNVGAIIVVLTPQIMTQIQETAEAVAAVSKRTGKPILTAFMGKQTIAEGERILREHGLPNYPVPERAVAALAAMVRQREWQERPLPAYETFDVDKDAVAEVFAQVRADGRLTMGDAEARAVQEAYGIPYPKSILARTADEAAAAADEIGYPVVMKITSPDILHKTDIGGVKLNLQTPEQVRDTFDLMIYRAQRFEPAAEIWGCLVQQQVKGGKEVLLGMNRDPQFGPLLVFGLGGIYVEALRDVTFRVAPVDRREATEMLGEIRAYPLLRGVRGEPPSDMDAIVDVILRLSQLVTDFPEIVELDINPLMVYEQGKGVLGIDMRLVLK
jgi:acetyltransferase